MWGHIPPLYRSTKQLDFHYLAERSPRRSFPKRKCAIRPYLHRYISTNLARRSHCSLWAIGTKLTNTAALRSIARFLFGERSPRRVLCRVLGPRRPHRTMERHWKTPIYIPGLSPHCSARQQTCQRALRALTYCTSRISRDLRCFLTKTCRLGVFAV